MNNTRKLVQLALLSFVFIFNANGRGIRLEFGQRFPLPVRTEYSLLSQWERKPVLDSLLIEDMEQDSEWQATGIAECYYTEEHAVDGRRSLRFRTSLVDTAYYRLPMNRTPWNSFKGEQGGYASVGRTFEKLRIGPNSIVCLSGCIYIPLPILFIVFFWNWRTKVLIIILLHRVSTILSKTLFRDNGIMYYGRYHILRGIK